MWPSGGEPNPTGVWSNTVRDAIRELAATAATGIRSDEFNASNVDTSVWTYVDPLGDTTLTMNGRQAVISLPAGARHDLWTGVDEVPRLVQAAPNGDFEVEVKFDSAVSAGYQMQGLIVQQDTANLLRLEVHHDGGSAHLFIARVVAGVAIPVHYSDVPGGAPVYLRLKRAGSFFMFSFSSDGATWTPVPAFASPMTVAAIGPFAGNSGGAPPAFSASIDYFREITPAPPAADTTPPVISGVSASASALGASITWTTDEAASSRVDHGSSSTYDATVSDPELRTSHQLSVSGLACNTTYHYEVRSSDAAGNEGRSGDQTFTTAACATSLVSDEFNSSSLDTGVWTFVDPVGDTTLSMTGTQALISLPAGSRHDLWTGVDEVPRLMQAAPNSDFEVEVKFDSAVSSGYQLEGLIVQQDAGNLLRLEVHSDGGGAHLFVAGVTDGAASTVHYSNVAGGAPVYLRLKRAGDVWTFGYSNDGASWTSTSFTRSMTVRAVGPFAGNSGGEPPAFEARIDYFRYFAPDGAAPEISLISATPGAIGAEVTWTTDEPATSRVDYGTTSAYGSQASTTGLRTSHQITLSGLTCATAYHYQVRSADGEGNVATSADQTFTTAPCPTALTSDEFDASTLDKSLWTYVDPLGDTTLTMSGTQAVLSVPAGTRHDLWTGTDEMPRLVQAAPNEEFEVQVKFDSAVTTRYQMQGLLVEQDASNLLRLEVHHDGEATRLFLAGITAGSASLIHESTVAGGAPTYLRLKRKGTSWTLRYSNDGSSWTSTSFTRAMTVRAMGPFAGNSGNSPPAFQAKIDHFRYFPPDQAPPQLTGISATSGAISAGIAWTTDEPATSTVAYGPTSAYGDGTISVPGERQSHRVQLHGLLCASTYHYQVRSQDSEGNAAASADRTFTTAACPTALVSDEFNASTLDSSLWVFHNPLGDVTATATGTQASISVPAGTAHDVWTTFDTLPRLLQAAPNANFEVDVKFDSPVATRYQQQGIIVEQDAQHLLRIEMHSEGVETKLFIASIMAGAADIKVNRTIAGGAPSYLRVKRTGSTWLVGYSTDGETWTNVGFTLALAPSAIGPFAGNGGPTPPAFSSLVDYFRVVPPPPPDTTAPAMTSVAALAHQVSATITWSTNELATSMVEWGTTTSYGQQPVSATLNTTAHRLRLTGLACSTTYHYRVRSTDEAGNEAVSTDRTFAAGACTSGPSIAVWYGDTQTFGTVGVPQRWINVLGNVEDASGVASLSYTLNGGPSRPLNVGPNDDRLSYQGDFNIELDSAELDPGENEVEITALDSGGNSSVREVRVDWQGNTGTSPPANGPVLVLVAHPDDEALGFAGIIHQARAAGRKVYVAVTTNGDSGVSGSESGYCGAAAGDPATNAAYGLRRSRETATAMELLGLHWSANLATTDIIFLGYPQLGLDDIAATGGTSWTGDATGLHRTYGEDFDLSNVTCDGDFRYLLSGRHSDLTAEAYSADMDALLDLIQPSDIYTHVDFDAHSDHVKTQSSLVAAIVRNEVNVRLHGTLIHPHETEGCQLLAAAQWPNPALENNDPFARFTPAAMFLAPPTPPCDETPSGTSWGPEGAPNESVEVPLPMQATTEEQNLKWQVISRYETQINCTNPDEYHVNCGYMRAFVKRNEFFWTTLYSPQKTWPMPYTAQFPSAASAYEQAQVIEGRWTYDGNGVRPVETGFDRLLTLGDTRWTNYEVTADITLNSFSQARPEHGAAVGLAFGWQGHTAWGQPRFGHPSGGLCLYAWNAHDDIQWRVQIGYSPGEAHDTIVATNYTDFPLGVPLVIRFRELDLGNGTTRYSCKIWRKSNPEPTAWTAQADIPHWQGESGTHPGSVVLVAHHADATFGDVTVVPVGG